jgi:hypothetical protein
MEDEIAVLPKRSRKVRAVWAGEGFRRLSRDHMEAETVSAKSS